MKRKHRCKTCDNKRRFFGTDVVCPSSGNAGYLTTMNPIWEHCGTCNGTGAIHRRFDRFEREYVGMTSSATRRKFGMRRMGGAAQAATFARMEARRG